MPRWQQFQKETKSNVLIESGVMCFGSSDDAEFMTLADNARRRDGDDRNIHDAKSMRENYPLFRTPDDGAGIFDEQGGAVRSEMAVHTAVSAAISHGAEVVTGTRVLGWALHNDRVRVFTSGKEYVVDKIVVTPGAYITDLLPTLPIRVRKLCMAWFAPEPEYMDAYSSPDFPAFHGSIPHRRGEMIYGAQSLDKPYVKIGGDFNTGMADTIDQRDFHVVPEDLEGIRMMARERFVGLQDAPIRSVKLVDGWTVDYEALVGNYGPSGRIILATGFSGYGFMVSPVMGEIVADLIEKEETGFNIDHLDPNRFTTEKDNLYEWWAETGSWNRKWGQL